MALEYNTVLLILNETDAIIRFNGMIFLRGQPWVDQPVSAHGACSIPLQFHVVASLSVTLCRFVQRFVSVPEISNLTRQASCERSQGLSSLQDPEVEIKGIGATGAIQLLLKQHELVIAGHGFWLNLSRS